MNEMNSDWIVIALDATNDETYQFIRFRCLFIHLAIPSSKKETKIT